MAPIRLNFTAVVKNTVKALERYEQETKKALRSTTTRIAANSRRETKKELGDKLDRPVPWIQNAYFFKPATDLENPEALLFVVEDERLEYLESITETGEHIESEITLESRNNGLLRANEILVPTPAVKRDRRGNVGPNRYGKFKRQGITVKNGPRRGIYIKSGKGKRAKFTKVLHPVTYTNYTPRVKPRAIVEKQSEQFQALYDKDLSDRIARALGRR